MALSPSMTAFAARCANWNGGATTVCLTFDTDFAPDYMIEHLLGLITSYGVRATFFATHASATMARVAADSRYEVGVHPNLTPSTTQGQGFEDIMTRLRSAYPNAVGNRFHVLGYSYRDLVALGRHGFVYDVSTLRFNCPYLLPAWHPDLRLVLLTYSWEDGICENAGLPLTMDSVDLDSPGLKILNFHPMNVFLNGPDPSTRLSFLRDNPDLLRCPAEVAARYRRSGPGAETVLRGVLERTTAESGRHFWQVREVAEEFRRALPFAGAEGV